MIYLIHFDEKIKHAQHYIGCTTKLHERLERHVRGHGAVLLKVANERGIGWRVVRLWKDAKQKEERLMKNQKNGPQFCPVCQNNPRDFHKIDEFPLELIAFPLNSKDLLHALYQRRFNFMDK